MSTAYIMKAAECVAAAEKISDRAERAALLKVAGSYLLASEVADRQDQDPLVRLVDAFPERPSRL